jgi:hypothetical protein
MQTNKVEQGDQAMIESKPSTTSASATENGKSVESVVIPPVVDETPLPPDPIEAVTATPVPVADPEEEKKLLESTWPPPLYMPRSASLSEKYYMKHRFQSQWLWYDKKSAENKNKHQVLQVVIGVGSVAVPVLLGIETLRSYAVWVSLVVAAAASIENVKKYGENWRSYRRAAENLNREKALYDVQAGPYKAAKRPFARFVERCEEVIAQQNGQFYQRDEQQTQTQTTSQQGGGRNAVTETETETTISTG